MTCQPISLRAAQPIRWLLAVLTSLFLLVGIALVAPTPSRAAQNAVTVTLNTSTAVVLSDASSKITISGTLANTSSQNLSAVQAYVWRDQGNLHANSDLSRYLASPDDQPVGTRWVNDQGTGWVAVTTAQQPVFQPGQSASFTLSTTLGELGLRGPGVYPLGVQIRAQAADGSNTTVGRARTTLTVLARKGAMSYTPIVLLTAPPSFLGGTTFKNLNLVTDLTSRLTPLLNRARQTSSTLVVDPGLVDEVKALTTGFQLVAGAQEATPTPADQQAIAKSANAWLTELQSLIKTRDAYRLPYGNPDLSIPVANGDTDALQRIRDAVTSTNAVAGLPVLVIARAGTITSEYLAAVKTLAADTVLSSGAPNGVDAATGITIGNLADHLTAGGPGPTPRNTLSQQIAVELATAQVSAQPLVVAISSTADIALDTAVHAWLTPTPLTASTTKITIGSDTLTTDQTWETARNAATKQFGAWGDLTTQRSAARVRLNQALARSLSLSLSGNQHAAFINQTVAVIGNVLGGKLLYARLSPPDFVLSSQTNELPASVTNKLDTAVTVRLAFTSENPQRISIPQTDLVTIPPGETVIVHFSPHAYTNGSVTAWAQLQTPSGRAIGEQIKVTISATSFGEIGWVIIIVSGVVFLGATALRVRQVQRDRAASSSTERANVARHTASTVPLVAQKGQTVGNSASLIDGAPPGATPAQLPQSPPTPTAGSTR